PRHDRHAPCEADCPGLQPAGPGDVDLDVPRAPDELRWDRAAAGTGRRVAAKDAREVGSDAHGAHRLDGAEVATVRGQLDDGECLPARGVVRAYRLAAGLVRRHKY